MKFLLSLIICLFGYGSSFPSLQNSLPLVMPKGKPMNVTASSKIVGGHWARPHAYPHQVAMPFGKRFCSGSLISDQHVLTAAHCVIDVEKISVLMGAHHLYEDEPTQKLIRATEFIIHEEYDPSLNLHDIAIIKFPHPIEFTDAIQAGKLPMEDEPVGTLMAATGWGKTKNIDTTYSEVLREVEVPTMSVEDCQIFYEDSAGPTVLCVNDFGGKGICDGDSGGPLNYGGKIYGITSFSSSLGCESGFPAGFTRVTSHLQWIEEKTGVKPSI